MKKKILIFIITYKAQKRVYNVFKKINFGKLKNINLFYLLVMIAQTIQQYFIAKKYLKNLNTQNLL